MNSSQIIAELSKINTVQPTAAAAVFMALRARMESKAEIPNRIGRMFSGNRGVLFVGKAGVGKTRFMSKIFGGLCLRACRNGRPIGKWLPSTGGSTGVGMYEVLETHYDSIIFADELSLDTPMHVHVMKQIAHGKLCRPRHRSLDEVPFRGLLIGATNSIKLPSNKRSLEHLLATLDRFMVVQVRAPRRTALQTLDLLLDDTTDPEPDWKALSRALTRKNTADLAPAETQLLRDQWTEKSRQILDPTRAQFRNSHTAIDIFLFIKRFLGVPDITKDDAARQFACQMLDDCILFNPVSILNLAPLEEVLYNAIADTQSIAMQDLLIAVEQSGMSFSRQHITRILNRMIENNVIRRTSHGKYSTKMDPEVVEGISENKIPDTEVTDQDIRELTDAL